MKDDLAAASVADPEDGCYRAVTRAIEISVLPVYLDEQSEPEDDRFVWAYQIGIANGGAETVQLLRRYWRITDATGAVQEVRGDGVVGDQPILGPGTSYQYTSGVPLSTPSGMMVGHYEFVSDTGEAFDVAIPAFSLDSPHQAINLN